MAEVLTSPIRRYRTEAGDATLEASVKKAGVEIDLVLSTDAGTAGMDVTLTPEQAREHANDVLRAADAAEEEG